MNLRAVAVGAVLASLLTLLASARALARNPHCAGGIQYVVGGLRDKDRGNTEDYLRQMQKAVAQLEQCASEDPNDFEAMGYLGWAYAEIESCGPAGRWFSRAIEGLNGKGDKKKAENAEINRNSYWITAYNAGVAKIKDAKSAYPDFIKKPENDADVTLKGEAEKRYQEALSSLTCAVLLRPGHAQTMLNMGSVYAFMGDFPKAEAVYRAALKVAPDDSSLKLALHSVRTNYANQLSDEKRYDEAIAYFGDLLKAEPDNADLHAGVAGAYFSRAQAAAGDSLRKPGFKRAGEEYQKAGELKAADCDAPFNAAVAYEAAGEFALAEAQWRAALKCRPDDPDIRFALAGTLAELGKNGEAISLLQAAIAADPKNKKLHRQLGGVYSKASNNAKATEELMVFLALDKGQPTADPAAAAKLAKPGSEAAKTLAAMGPPEQLYPWEAQGEKYETWFYWTKKQAYHFKGGALAVKSDWSTAAGATGARN